MYCKNCGGQIPDGTQFCKYCGAYCGGQKIDVDSGIEIYPGKSSGKKVFLIIGLVLLLIAGVFCTWWFVFRDTKVTIDRPTFSVESGKYETEQAVSISTSDNNKLTVYYTIDGSTPGISSKKYEYGTLIRIKESTKIKCIAIDERGNTSDVAMGEYIIEKKDQTTSNKQTQDSTIKQTNTSSYILADSNSRYYSESEIRKLSKKDRCYARNEIYARHGLIFKSQELQNYFNAQSWYKGVTAIERFDTSVFNDYENKNIQTIKAVEDAEGAY